MPGFDGTGPNGKGPMTGRGEGYCVLERKRRDGAEVLEGIAGAAGRPVKRPLFASLVTNGLGPWAMGRAGSAYYAGYPIRQCVPPIHAQMAPYGAAMPRAPVFVPYHFLSFYGPAFSKGFVPAWPRAPGFGGGMYMYKGARGGRRTESGYGW